MPCTFYYFRYCLAFQQPMSSNVKQQYLQTYWSHCCEKSTGIYKRAYCMTTRRVEYAMNAYDATQVLEFIQFNYHPWSYIYWGTYSITYSQCLQFDLTYFLT